MTQIRVFLKTDPNGPGSYDEMVSGVQRLLEENFRVPSEEGLTDSYHESKAREIVDTVLHRMNIAVHI